MNAWSLRCGALLVLLSTFAGCTRLRPVTTPVEPAATGSPLPEESPAGFASEPPATPSPTPTPIPPPKIILSEPTSATDFSTTKVSVAFTATATTGRKIASAQVLYDGRPIGAFKAEGPSFRLDDWDPNVENNFADPPETKPVRSGDHVLIVTATDDKGAVGKIEVGIFKQLKITGWQEIAAMPNATSHHHVASDAAAPPSFVSLWGSIDGIESTAIPRPDIFGFSPVGNGQWTTLTTNGNSVPRAGYGMAVHPSGQLFYIAGGRLGKQDLRTLDLYAPLRKAAEQALVSMTNGRRDPAVAYVDDALYVIGGQAGTSPIYSVERVKIGPDGAPVGEFEAMADLQNARSGPTALVQGKEIWVFGGGHRPIEVYDTLTNTWKFLTDPAGTPIGTPEAWRNAEMVQANGRVYFFGGEKDDGQAIDRVYEFNPVAKTWRELGTMPTIADEDAATRPLTRVAGFFHENAFYLMGGMTLPGRKTSARVYRGSTL